MLGVRISYKYYVFGLDTLYLSLLWYFVNIQKILLFKVNICLILMFLFVWEILCVDTCNSLAKRVQPCPSIDIQSHLFTCFYNTKASSENRKSIYQPLLTLYIGLT